VQTFVFAGMVAETAVAEMALISAEIYNRSDFAKNKIWFLDFTG